MKNNIFIIEDHDEALEIWRGQCLPKRIDLVHIDAHVDFEFYPAKTKTQVIDQAKDVRHLKRELEKFLLYQKFQQNFEKQLNIGNYVYPAMCEKIIKNFYWVVPGDNSDFRKSLDLLKKMLKDFSRRAANTGERIETGEGFIKTNILGNNFFIFTLNKLPTLKQSVLLDIDLDFLLIKNLNEAEFLDKTKERTPWIRCREFIKLLKQKIEQPKVITIAYSTNGGFTPITYRYMADEIAYLLNPYIFKKRYADSIKASYFFQLFKRTGNKEYYNKAFNLDSFYRSAYNNLGHFYLSMGRTKEAYAEFNKIREVDRYNAINNIGLGQVCLRNKSFYKAKKCFDIVLKNRFSPGHLKHKYTALIGYAQAEYGLRHVKKAKHLFLTCSALRPMDYICHYFLGLIYEKEKKHNFSLSYYKNAIRLGFFNLDIFKRSIKISKKLKIDTTDLCMAYDRYQKNGGSNERYSIKKESEYDFKVN